MRIRIALAAAVPVACLTFLGTGLPSQADAAINIGGVRHTMAATIHSVLAQPVSAAVFATGHVSLLEATAVAPAQISLASPGTTAVATPAKVSLPSPAKVTLLAPATATPAAATPAVVTPAPAPAPTPAPAAPAVVAAPPVTDATSTNTADWQCIRVHESGDQYNSPSAPSGAYGIISVTWHSFGYSGWPYQAPASVQDALALHLYNEYGWQPWSTRTVCGL